MKQLKETTMGDHPYLYDLPGADASAHCCRPEWAVAATRDRAAAWSSDRVLDPGDTHAKGERALCVGEAA